MLARPGLAEKGVEGVVPATNGLVRGHLAVWLNTVLQTVELPASIADLHSGLSNVDRDALTLEKEEDYIGDTCHIIDQHLLRESESNEFTYCDFVGNL